MFWLGPIPIHIWGLFAAVAFIVGVWLAILRAPRYNIYQSDILDVAIWIILAALIGARLSHVFLYEPSYYFAHPLSIIKIWEGGLSSLGGFLGASIAGLIFVRRRKISLADFADTIIGAAPLAYAIGRLGCAFTHMHPGMACAVKLFCRFFPDGARRLDLGLIESFWWLIIAAGIFIFKRRIVRPGATAVLILSLYGLGRFVFDFFRIADARYSGLTPAQYGALALIFLTVVFLTHEKLRQSR